MLLDINPFDEPNVQQAKDATRALLDTYAAQGRLPVPEPDASIEGVRVDAEPGGREDSRTTTRARSSALIRPGDYFALLAYLPPDDDAFAQRPDGIPYATWR